MNSNVICLDKSKPSKWYHKWMDWFLDKYQWSWWYRRWYSFKCRYIKKYSTVTPRSLDRGDWVDSRDLVPHAMFEILSQFVEEECGPDCYVDWKRSGHTVTVVGEEVNVRDEMQCLYEWWPTYLEDIEHTHDEWHEFREAHSKHIDEPIINEDGPITSYKWVIEWDTDDNEKRANELFKDGENKERVLSEKLQDNLHRLVNIIPFLWT